MTPRQFAEKHGVAYTTVMKWLQNDLISGAYKEELRPPFQGYIYQIPENARRPESKPGPKPKTSDNQAVRSAKQARTKKAKRRE